MKFWKEGAIIVATAGGIFWVAFTYYLEPLRYDVRSVADAVKKLSDHETGYPRSIRRAANKGIEDMIRENRLLRLEISTTFDKALTDAVAESNDGFERRHQELVAEIKAQTRQHTVDIGRLEGQLRVVENFQEIILRGLREKGFQIQKGPPKLQMPLKQGLLEQPPFSRDRFKTIE